MPERLECPLRCDASQFTACFEHCTTAGSVRDIDLHSCSGPLTAIGMMHLQCCTGLTSLKLGVKLGRLTVDPALWEQLDAQNWTCFNTLETLRAYNNVSIVTAEIWGRRFSALVNISIHGPTDDGVLEHICKIKTLQDVSLGGAGLEHLKKLPALRSLSFCGYFMDEALGHIKDITTLRELTLSGSQGLSAVGIALIAEGFKLLEKLSLNFCSAVTDADLPSSPG